MIRIPSDGWASARLPVMDCGHPLASRQIAVVDGRLVTDCWACAVQRDIISRIVGPAHAQRIKHRDIAS